MSETLSVRLDAATKQRLELLARQSKRSKSFLAAEAISAYVALNAWQLGEIEAGISDMESGKAVSHEKVAKWLKSWGSRAELKAPR